MRRGRILQLFFIAHGVVHVLAFQAAFGWGAMEEFTPIPAFPVVRFGSPAARLLGGVWLLAAIAFLMTATLVVRDDRRWRPLAFTAALISLAACILWWRDAPAGAAIDLLILGGLAAPSVRHLGAGQTLPWLVELPRQRSPAVAPALHPQARRH